jgi:transcriptional regulator with XRE-family HTH domain
MIELGPIASIASLMPLTDDERDDAEFRAKDRAWAALVERFEERRENEGLNYRQLGDRIGRSRKQVQRWLGSSFNMTLQSLGLLAEALDADLKITVTPRRQSDVRVNYTHPSEDARAFVKINLLTTPLQTPTTASPTVQHLKREWHSNAAL